MCRGHFPALLAAILAGCAAPPTDGEAPPAGPLQITLADSIRYGDGMVDGYLHRVVVSSGARRDTVPGVLVRERPVVAPDGAVYGIRSRDELAVGLFAYDVAARRVRTLPTPAGWSRSGTPRLAPDGRHVAYLAYATDGTAHAAVAALPGGRVIYRGPGTVLLETGAGVDEISWSSPAHFEIRIAMGGDAGGVQRVRGSLAPLAAQVDTLPYPW